MLLLGHALQQRVHIIALYDSSRKTLDSAALDAAYHSVQGQS